MIDPLRDEAVWLLTAMHKAKAVKGQGESHRLIDDIYFMAYGPAHTAKQHATRDVTMTIKSRSIMFFNHVIGEIPRILWLVYDLSPGKIVTNVQVLYSDGEPTPEDEFWWMTMFVSYRNKLLRKPPYDL